MPRRPILQRIRRRLDAMTWGGVDGARFGALVRIARAVMPDYRVGWYQRDWWRDAEFNAYLARIGEPRGHNSDRRWMVHQLLRLVADVPGDTAECGVYEGATSLLIAKANARSEHDRMHFMFDSFAGLSQPHAADGSYWRAGDLRRTEDVARARLAGLEGMELMPGWIPDRFHEVADRRFAFVHVDVDLYEPTRDSLAFFWPRLADGGILVVDDYGFSTCPGATRAVREVLQDRLIALPDGGGFAIKGRTIAPRAPLG
jgi:O-methyltransferase